MTEEEAIRFVEDHHTKGTYVCKALFPRSVSTVAPSSLTLMILEDFLVPSRDNTTQSQPKYLQEKLTKKCSANTSVKNDVRKQKLVEKWIDQDLCFSTKAQKPHLEPISLRVPAAFPWKKKQEPYGAIVKSLLRTGRNHLGEKIDEPLSLIIKSFNKTHEDPHSSVLFSCLPEPREENWRLDEKAREKYIDSIFCSSQGRIFQEDITHMFNWEISASIRSKWVTQIITFHLCTHYLKMAILVDDLVSKAKNYIFYPGSGLEKISCEKCPSDCSENPPVFQENCINCDYNPGYFLNDNERTQVWYEALNRYQENVSVLAMITTHMNNGKKEPTREDLSDYLKNIKSNYAARTGDIKRILRALDDHHTRHAPTAHGWDFFGRYACTNEETKFATRQVHGKFGINLSKKIIMIFSHCFISIQESKSKPPLFTDFLDYLRSRGFKTQGIDTCAFENNLRSQGLMDSYADMGSARQLKPTLKAKI